ncbi:MAG: helix-turn-helix domain-containing protein [Clostridia bacterium]|nr:helix-turn-helix domain-containing protein [Clostridia bacterium]
MSFIEIEYREKQKPFAMTALQSHDYYEIYCLMEGDRQVFFENCMFTLSKGAICVIPPFRMHKMEGGPYKRINLYISPDLLDTYENAFLKECSERVAFVLDEKEERLFFSLIESFAKELGSETNSNDKYLLSLTRVLICILKKSKLVSIPTVTVEQTKKDDNGLILQIIDYINAHLEQNICLDDISERFFISKNTLCKKFRSIMRCSVVEYILGARQARAKNLLVTTDLSMDEIAERCGYSSANYFSLIFKKNVGISPLNYRKKK